MVNIPRIYVDLQNYRNGSIAKRTNYEDKGTDV